LCTKWSANSFDGPQTYAPLEDPPCVRAKREYEDILLPNSGEFRCIADGAGDDPLVIEVLAAGPKIKRAVFAATVAAGTGIGSQPFAHGRSDD
jgi:hypothetical protein